MESPPVKSHLAIHQDRLDEDCSEQPTMIFDWGSRLASVSRKVKETKNHLKVVAAEVRQDVRMNPQNYGLTKPTEGAADDAVTLDGEYQQLQKELIELEEEQDILEAYVRALADRKSELESLVKLFMGMYWSKPNTAETREMVRERQKDVVERPVSPRKKK